MQEVTLFDDTRYAGVLEISNDESEIIIYNIENKNKKVA